MIKKLKTNLINKLKGRIHFAAFILIALLIILNIQTVQAAQNLNLNCVSFQTRSGVTVYYLALENQQISATLKSPEECHKLIQIIEHRHADPFSMPDVNQLKYFNLTGPNANVGFTLRQCKVPNFNYHPAKTDADGYLTPECTPDTLYSWGGPDKAVWYIDNLKNNTQWPELLSRSLYTISSAAATFGYGVIPLRFKIKPGVRFKLLVSPSTNECDGFVRANYATPSELKTTIFTRLHKDGDFSFFEHIVCSPNVISSWSFGYTFHYDEILADHTWMTTHPKQDWESYVHMNNENLYIDANIDKANLHTDFTLKSFLNKMRLLQALGASKGGYLSAEGGQGYQTRIQKHFETSHPSYFNFGK